MPNTIICLDLVQLLGNSIPTIQVGKNTHPLLFLFKKDNTFYNLLIVPLDNLSSSKRYLAKNDLKMAHIDKKSKLKLLQLLRLKACPVILKFLQCGTVLKLDGCFLKTEIFSVNCPLYDNVVLTHS